MKKIVYILSLGLLFHACSEDNDSPEQIFVPLPPVVQEVTEPQVLVLNEGNFLSGNGSVSFYNAEDDLLFNKVFQSNNAGRLLGDVVQSMVEIDNKYFIVINNSNKIEVVNKMDFSSLGKIDPINQPRFILPISSTKAYVSEISFGGQGVIHIIDPSSLSKTSQISTIGWTEEMIMSNGRAYICNVSNNNVAVYDVNVDTLITEIPAGVQPQHIAMDKNGMLWVASSGGFNQSNPALTQINPKNNTVVKKLEFNDVSKSISEIEFNKEGDQLIYLMGDLFKVSIDATDLPTTPFISANSRTFYGLGVHPKSGDIYVSDAIDFSQKGTVYRYDKSGNEITNFKADVIPGAFFMRN